MKMKIRICVNPKTGEIFYYIPTPNGQTVLIEPRIKKKEEEPEEDEEKTH